MGPRWAALCGFYLPQKTSLATAPTDSITVMWLFSIHSSLCWQVNLTIPCTHLLLLTSMRTHCRSFHPPNTKQMDTHINKGFCSNCAKRAAQSSHLGSKADVYTLWQILLTEYVLYEWSAHEHLKHFLLCCSSEASLVSLVHTLWSAGEVMCWSPRGAPGCQKPAGGQVRWCQSRVRYRGAALDLIRGLNGSGRALCMCTLVC